MDYERIQSVFLISLALFILSNIGRLSMLSQFPEAAIGGLIFDFLIVYVLFCILDFVVSHAPIKIRFKMKK